MWGSVQESRIPRIPTFGAPHNHAGPPKSRQVGLYWLLCCCSGDHWLVTWVSVAVIWVVRLKKDSNELLWANRAFLLTAQTAVPRSLAAIVLCECSCKCILHLHVILSLRMNLGWFQYFKTLRPWPMCSGQVWKSAHHAGSPWCCKVGLHWLHMGLDRSWLAFLNFWLLMRLWWLCTLRHGLSMAALPLSWWL